MKAYVSGQNPGRVLPATFLVFLFFLSGFSALLYQVIWQRMLGLFSGADVYSVTIIVSAFMLGMGFGGMAGGYLADRFSRNRLVALFAIAELTICIFALISKWFYYDILYQTFPGLSGSFVGLSITLFFSLLIPTFFMGITLPLLSKALVSHIDEAPLTIGLLYSLNTLGAAIGSIVTAVVLIRHFGFEFSIRVGAFLNFIAMTGALGILFFYHNENKSIIVASDGNINAAKSLQYAQHLSFRSWLLVYAMSGFVALGLEIVWFRILGVMLKSTAFTFGVLLFIYLLGLALGTLAGTFFARYSRKPQAVFFALQAGITLYAAVALSVFVYYVDKISSLSIVWNYFSAPINFPFAFDLGAATPEFMVMYFIVAPLLILPSTLLMGASFPYLQKVAQSDLASLGRRIGWLQTANIIGSTLGACIVGLLLLELLGTTGTLMLLVVLGAVHLFLLLKTSVTGWKRNIGYLASALVVVSAAFFIPSANVFWSKLYGTPSTWQALYAEDSTGLAFIKMSKAADFTGDQIARGQAFLFINGATESDFPFGEQHSALGLVPAMIHPEPLDIMIIGLGSGDTLFSAGGRSVTKSITSVEILASQLPNLHDLHELRPYAALETLFEDPRFHFVFADARTWLMRSDRKFDIIEADPLRPNMAYAGNLYSTEYYTLIKNHLKPGGYAVSWMPSGRTIQSFRSVFPYTLNIGYWMFIGSNEPIVVDRDAVMKRIHSPEVQSYYKNTAIDVVSIMNNELSKIVNEPQEQWHGNLDTNSDLFPKDEYEKPER